MYEQREDTSKRRFRFIKEHESLHVGSGHELRSSGPAIRLIRCGVLVSLSTELLGCIPKLRLDSDLRGYEGVKFSLTFLLAFLGSSRSSRDCELTAYGKTLEERLRSKVRPNPGLEKRHLTCER